MPAAHEREVVKRKKEADLYVREEGPVENYAENIFQPDGPLPEGMTQSSLLETYEGCDPELPLQPLSSRSSDEL